MNRNTRFSTITPGPGAGKCASFGYRPVFLVVISMLIACQSGPNEKPSLSDEKIAQIMADLSVAEATTNGLNAYAKDSTMQAYFKQVFEIHGVTREVYEKDLRIIAKDLNHLDRLIKEADKHLMEATKKLESPSPQ